MSTKRKQKKAKKKKNDERISIVTILRFPSILKSPVNSYKILKNSFNQLDKPLLIRNDMA